MDLTPFLGIAGVAVLVLMGAGLLGWLAFVALGWRRRRTTYEIHHVDDDEEDGDGLEGR